MTKILFIVYFSFILIFLINLLNLIFISLSLYCVDEELTTTTIGMHSHHHQKSAQPPPVFPEKKPQATSFTIATLLYNSWQPPPTNTTCHPSVINIVGGSSLLMECRSKQENKSLGISANSLPSRSKNKRRLGFGAAMDHPYFLVQPPQTFPSSFSSSGETLFHLIIVTP